MKSLSLTIVLLVLGVVCFAQLNVNHLLEQRSTVYQKYIAHSDTMTINTWLNIMNSKKLLEQIVHFDTLIMAASVQSMQQDSFPSQELSLSQINQELIAANQQLLTQKQNAAIAEAEIKSYKKYLGILAVLALLLFVGIVMSAFLSIRVNKRLKLNEKKTKEYHTDLYAAKHEIEKSIKIENQLASEINKVKQHFKKQLDDLIKEKELVVEEKLMLDNQIIEVKKAYDLETSKRIELENQIRVPGEHQKDNVQTGLKDNMIADLQAEIFDLSTVNESLKRGLEMAVEKNRTGDQLLIDELDKLKDKYDIEVKTRIKTQEELQVLLSKLKSHFKS